MERNRARRFNSRGTIFNECNLERKNARQEYKKDLLNAGADAGFCNGG